MSEVVRCRSSFHAGINDTGGLRVCHGMTVSRSSSDVNDNSTLSNLQQGQPAE